MAITAVPQPLKWAGGKSYMAKDIIALMPTHVHYVEPYFGGGAVLLDKNPQGVSEVVNDINKDLTNFWQVLQRAERFSYFVRLCEATPFSSSEWFDADSWIVDQPELLGGSLNGTAESIVRAWKFFIRCRQSRAGSFKEFATLTRTRTRRQMNEQASAWLSCVEGLPAVHARLKRVVILCDEAIPVIQKQDGPDTLFYCDPPYLHETRTVKDHYAHEMTKGEHVLMLAALADIRGKFILSGYDNPTYADWAAHCRWRKVDFDQPNQMAGGDSKRRRIESVWMNF